MTTQLQLINIIIIINNLELHDFSIIQSLSSHNNEHAIPASGGIN